MGAIILIAASAVGPTYRLTNSPSSSVLNSAVKRFVIIAGTQNQINCQNEKSRPIRALLSSFLAIQQISILFFFLFLLI